MKSNILQDSLEGEKIFFNDLISNRITNNKIPLEADYRRATFYLPEDNDKWNEIIDPKMFNIVEGKYRNDIFKRVIKKSGNVIDICCGPGATSLELAREGLKVKGFDLSNDAISMAKKMKDENPYLENFGSLEYHCQDINMINIQSEKNVSTIIGISAFHHIYDLENFLDNCYNSLEKGSLMITLDDIGHTKFDKFLKNILLFILPKYGLSYKEKFERIYKYIFYKKTVSNEIFSPMELYTSKHGASMKIIENFWFNKLKLEKVVYYGAFSVQVCNSIKGPAWFRYNVAKILTILDRVLIKFKICKGFYRIIYSTKD